MEEKKKPFIAYTDEEKKRISKERSLLPDLPKLEESKEEVPSSKTPISEPETPKVVPKENKIPQSKPANKSIPPKINTTSTRMTTPRLNISSKVSKTCKELIDKDTHYVFTFGYTGSGKSTFLAAFALYLEIKFNAISDPDNNQAGEALIGTMIKDLKRGKFPEATDENDAFEYNVVIEQDNGDEIDLTFIEMSGENLKAYDPTLDNKEREIIDEIDMYLRCPDLDITFLLIGDYFKVTGRKPSSKGEDQDFLLRKFLTRLVRRGMDLSRVALILTKFDLEFEEERLSDIIQGHMPSTDQFLNNSRHIKHPKVFPFTIGKINSDLDNAQEEGAIEEIELGDCEPIARWIVSNLSVDEKTKTSWIKNLFTL